MWYKFSVKTPDAYLHMHCIVKWICQTTRSIYACKTTNGITFECQWCMMGFGHCCKCTHSISICAIFKSMYLCVHCLCDTWCDQRHTNNIPDIGIHGCACYCHNLAQKNRKLFGKQNKTNEIKLDIAAATAVDVAAATVTALSIDVKPMAFFCDPYRCKLASNHHNSHGFWNEKESETEKKIQQQPATAKNNNKIEN